VVGAVHGVVPLALAGASLLFVAGVVAAGGGLVGLFPGDVAAGGALFDFAGGVFVDRFAVVCVG